MIPVKKGKTPPLLEWYRHAEGACWGENAPAGILKGSKVTFSKVREQTAQALAADQHGLCAYCMRRLNQNKSKQYADVRVEHYKPQSMPGADPLDYANMLACCMGHLCKGVDCCDQKKGKVPITLNPLDGQHPVSLYIRYDADGTILAVQGGKAVPKNHALYKDLNRTLNLNHDILKSIRKNARLAVMNAVKRAFPRSPKPTKQWVAKRIKDIEANGSWPGMWECTKFFLQQSCKQHK